MENKPEKPFRKLSFNRLLMIIGGLILVALICFILYDKGQFSDPVEKQVKHYDYEACSNIEDKSLEEECIINKALREDNENLCLELSASQQEKCRKLLLGKKFVNSPEEFDCSILYDKFSIAIQSCELYKNHKLQGIPFDCREFKDEDLRKLCSDAHII